MRTLHAISSIDKIHRHALILLVLAVLAPACGGGGGGGSSGGGGAGVFTGDYHRMSFTGQSTTNIGRIGASVFSGFDYSEAGISNNNGTIDSMVDSGTFAVSGADFTFAATGPFSFSGGVRPDRSMAISAPVSAGPPTFVVELRKGACSDATLSGTYFIVGYGFE